MGGCRCTYSNCTVKSDKKTHMFHYPVFDKMRCHQWLTNAQKLHFLDLKLSQLKNRVVCQHHFKDDDFMNITRGKLKNSAIPTEDGPFCKQKLEKDDGDIMPINLDDIENECLTNMEKRAHFSVKYGDFLTNDVTETINLVPNNKATPNSLQIKEEKDNTFIRIHRNNPYNNTIYYNITSSNYSAQNNINNVKLMDMDHNDKKTVTNVATSYQNNLPNPKMVAIEFEELNLNPTEESDKSGMLKTTTLEKDFRQLCTFPSHKVKQSVASIPTNKKVKIISEKKISEPLKLIKGELLPVSPSLIIKVPDKKKKHNVEVNETQIETVFIDVSNPQDVKNVQTFNSCRNETSQPIVTHQLYSNEDPTKRKEDHTQNTEGYEKYNVQNVNQLTEGIKPILQFTPECNHVQVKPEALTVVKHVSTTPTEMQYSSTTPHASVSITESKNSSIVSMDMHGIPQTSIKDLNVSRSVNTKQVTDLTLTENTQTVLESSKSNKMQKMLCGPLPNKSLLKSKMPPEKLAAIEEKRRFNMKLRDIIDSCLNKLDEEPIQSKSSPASNLIDKKVAEYFSKDPNLPSSQENNIAYLETRLQRMEDTLLNKIEQNTQRIGELKRTIKPSSGKKSAFTQTYSSVDTTKKQLYQQISQFLSPEANSLIYEELFINKYSQHMTKTEPSPKKRKKR